MRISRNALSALSLALAGGLAWMLPGPIGPACSLLLILATRMAGTRSCRYVAAMLYFLAGSWGIVPGAGVFGLGTGLGADLWVASAMLLALPWIWADRWWRVILAVLLDAIPPLGLFGWLSPLTASGILYPGFGMIGLSATLAVIGLVEAKQDKMLGAFMVAAISANLLALFSHQPTIPPGWIGVETRAGLVPEDPLAQIQRNAQVIASAAQQSQGYDHVILPETVAGDWMPGTAMQYRDAVPGGQRWLVGAVLWADNAKWDALTPVDGQGGAGKGMAIKAAFPVPVSMWHPWRAGGYAAAWWEPVREIWDQRVFAGICYDQLLPWVWMEALIQRPSMILAVSNVWWARRTNIPHIERVTSEAWARLAGAPVVFAINR